MKVVEVTPAVNRSLSTLGADGVRRVHAWFDYLRRWDEDAVVRQNSLPLPGFPNTYVLKTTTDLRFIFRVDGGTVTVLEVTTQAALDLFAGYHVNGTASPALTP